MNPCFSDARYIVNTNDVHQCANSEPSASPSQRCYRLIFVWSSNFIGSATQHNGSTLKYNTPLGDHLQKVVVSTWFLSLSNWGIGASIYQAQYRSYPISGFWGGFQSCVVLATIHFMKDTANFFPPVDVKPNLSTLAALDNQTIPSSALVRPFEVPGISSSDGGGHATLTSTPGIPAVSVPSLYPSFSDG